MFKPTAPRGRPDLSGRDRKAGRPIEDMAQEALDAAERGACRLADVAPVLRRMRGEADVTDHWLRCAANAQLQSQLGRAVGLAQRHRGAMRFYAAKFPQPNLTNCFSKLGSTVIPRRPEYGG